MTQTSPTEQARENILSSGLSAQTIRNALALLDRAHPYNGHVKLTWESLADLWGLTHPGSVRRYLSRLVECRIIHYSTNRFVYVDFWAWPPADLRVGATESARGRADMRVGAQAEEDQSARGRADMRVGATESARGRAGEHALKGMSERVSSLTLSPEEKSQSITLLTDPAVFMSRRKAEDLAEQYDFETIRAFACYWLDEGREAGREAGLIAHRLQAAESVPPLRHNELWERHRTPAEIAQAEAEAAEAERLRQEMQAERERMLAERKQRQAEQAQAAPRASSPPRPSPSPDLLWEQVLAELVAMMPAATADTWLSGATGTLEDGTLTITAANAYARDWLQNRLSPQIRRLASQHAGRAIEIQFI